MSDTGPEPRSYVLISPCRNEADYMRRTLDSVVAQSLRPTLWVVVDDGSTDATPEILAEYTAKHDWIRVVKKPDRGHRAVGPGVVEAFYVGLDSIEMEDFTYLCKLDLDLELPERYFETLVERMEENPRIGTCSGKPYMRIGGRLVSEHRGDELSVGMTKFYRVACFKETGGFVREVMWDAIDGHKARQLGWVVVSWDHPDLNFEHLRPMGSSQQNIHVGRKRHGFGQYYMGSAPLFYFATCVFRMKEPPYVTGGLAMAWGYIHAWLTGVQRQKDGELIQFIRAYQRRALRVGKATAAQQIEAERAHMWSGAGG
ncbi:MAG: glycosyltransferase family A protein [Pseudomonadota bacterium]